MVKSMTGFGRATGSAEGLSITVELKSVNHRYFEWSSRIPRSFAFLEEKLKSYCQSRISRGKIEFYLTAEADGVSPKSVDIDRAFAKSYIDALKTLSEEFGLKNDISVSSVARNNDIFVLTKTEINEEELTAAVLEITRQAVDKFIEMRECEGEKLKNDLVLRTDTIKRAVEFIEKRSPETVELYRQRLEQKIRELLETADIDEQRIITETAIFADKVAVAEETVRLSSHINQLLSMLESNEPIGRKLDFLVQEMNRETNTIGSKAQDIEIARTVVDVKAEIEKIREQVQNIE